MALPLPFAGNRSSTHVIFGVAAREESVGALPGSMLYDGHAESTESMAMAVGKVNLAEIK